MDPNLNELVAEGGQGEVQAIVRLASPGDAPPGVRIVSQFGDIATCRLPRDSVVETWSDDAVLSLKAARPFTPEFESENEQAEFQPPRLTGSDVRRPRNLRTTGNGCIVAVVDWGFDFGHDNFRRPDGSSRILALWDQSSDLTPHPEPYRYGRVFHREEISRALRSKRPYETLGYHHGKSDPRGRGTHGTHVLDIAAGNGRLRGSPLGIAPEADLLLVHASSVSAREPANLGDSVALLEGLDWIRAQAGATPFVVNMRV